MAVPRRAPYKDFLQPALQRRFASTVGVLLGIAYLESLTLSSWNSFIWSWFPVGVPGIRTLGIFGCALPIIILRIAHSHLGKRTSASPIETFRREISSLASIETVITYMLSAWLFSQFYLFSLPDDANLNWITYHSGDRARLNERALFYTVHLILLGFAYGIIHIALDRDRLSLGTVSPKTDEGPAKLVRQDPWDKLAKDLPRTIVRVVLVSMTVGVVNYVFVYSILRRSAWSWALAFFRWFYNLPKSNIPPQSAPWSVWMLIRSLWAGFLLSLLWSISDVFLTVQLAKEPIKNSQPLTSESKDPNGSLMNGLKSKKPRPSAFAIWELAYIARDFDDRRKAIFEDIDRPEGPMWAQIYSICMDKLKTIEKSIDEYGKVPAPVQQQAPAPAPASQRIVPPPSNEDVWAPPRQSTGLSSRVGGVVKSIGTSPGKTPAEYLGTEARRRIGQATDQYLTKEQKEMMSPEHLNSSARNLALRVLSTPWVGPIFHQDFRRSLVKAVLGTPYAEPSVPINAAFILSQLAVSSLAEDRYGNVQRDVSTIVRTFTVLIKKLEKFSADFPVHWTDLSGKRECPEVDALLDALKDGLSRLVTAFSPYATDLRLSRADMRLAKEAAEKPLPKLVEAAGGPEMEQVK
ncbi:nuclear envelope protein [Microdochium trichocladiopsis]|uniref:Nuclear envelope protein n=1 Tax=Microdochium trichocladiopsis TaxID=1682393 RepID=A0A9P9BVK9_9PEZI|nr:nuclear envelope protein [Microdochium trichocladiopsis]KAH7039852.1 nuclear envelope protein [Microdochium trichocladiopsis]